MEWPIRFSFSKIDAQRWKDGRHTRIGNVASRCFGKSHLCERGGGERGLTGVVVFNQDFDA